MERWRCPTCKREFGRTNQGHMCNPGMTLEEYYAQAAPFERPIIEVLTAHFESLGDVIVDPIDMGVIYKNGPTCCVVRAMKKWLAVGFSLGRRIDSDRISRKIVDHGTRHYHVINVSDPEQLDDELLDWLAEAYFTAGGATPSVAASGGSDPMVPDDIDDFLDD